MKWRLPALACICLVFSGILGCGEHPLLDSPTYEPAEVAVMETTDKPDGGLLNPDAQQIIGVKL